MYDHRLSPVIRISPFVGIERRPSIERLEAENKLHSYLHDNSPSTPPSKMREIAVLPNQKLFVVPSADPSIPPPFVPHVVALKYLQAAVILSSWQLCSPFSAVVVGLLFPSAYYP